MSSLLRVHVLRVATVAAIVVIAVGCGGGGGSATTSGGASPGASARASDTGSAAAGQGSVEGTITTSGAVSGTWSWKEGNAVSGTNAFEATISTADGRFGYVRVDMAGNVKFDSGAVTTGPWTGTGGKVELKGSGTAQHACGLSVDSTLKSGGTNPTTLTLKGSLSIKGTVVDPDIKAFKSEIKC